MKYTVLTDEMKKKDWSGLEGTPITCSFDEYKTFGTVAIIDYDMGFTISKEMAPDNHLVCFHGPSSNTPDPDDYDGAFLYLLNAIDTGELVVEEMQKANKALGYNPRSNLQECVFSL